MTTAEQIEKWLNTSADDLKSTLECGEAQDPPSYSPGEIEAALNEAEARGKKTHAKHLQTALNKARNRPRPVTRDPVTKMIPLVSVEIEEALQMRAGYDQDHIDDMVSTLKASDADLPPITVFAGIKGEHGKHLQHYYIGDGNHRALAYRLAKREYIPAAIQPQQGRSAAFRHALGANSEHNALRRTNADKRRAVKICLAHFPDESNVAVAKICAVHEGLVRKVKKEVEESANGAQPKDSAGREPEQIFLDLYFGSKRGILPSLARTLDRPDFATIPAEKWGELAAELRSLTEKAEERAGLTLSKKG